jgi:hypothetical protein
MIEPRQPPILEATNLDDEITRNDDLPTSKTVWTLTIVMTQLPDILLLEPLNRHLILTHFRSPEFFLLPTPGFPAWFTHVTVLDPADGCVFLADPADASLFLQLYNKARDLRNNPISATMQRQLRKISFFMGCL